MNISLNPHFDEFIAQQLASGRYNSASEVVREGLRLLEVQEKHQKMNLERLKQSLQGASESVAKGEWVDGETVFKKINTLLDDLEPRSS